jgi:hypothetical protein
MACAKVLQRTCPILRVVFRSELFQDLGPFRSFRLEEGPGDRVDVRRCGSAGRAGRKPRLSDEQLAAVEEALTNGAEANGYANYLWTLPRVAEVIARVTGSPITRDTYGMCCATSWTGPGNGQADARSNVTTQWLALPHCYSPISSTILPRVCRLATRASASRA